MQYLTSRARETGSAHGLADKVLTLVTGPRCIRIYILSGVTLLQLFLDHFLSARLHALFVLTHARSKHVMIKYADRCLKG